jgi:hypothetical protein
MHDHDSAYVVEEINTAYIHAYNMHIHGSNKIVEQEISLV